MTRAPKIYATEDARKLAKKRLPKMIFDFIEGSAGREVGAGRNVSRLDEIMLQPRAMADVGSRSLATRLLGSSYGVPFGIAPMGLCNLACPGADAQIADKAKHLNMPVCLSSAASSSLKDMYGWCGELAWFQLYFGQSEEASLAAVERAKEVGYKTLILTVDVPEVSRRVRDLHNGFNVPFRMTARAFLDFALHPRWSLSTLVNGIPSPKNFADDPSGFDRKASRAGADWEFLERLRERWPGKLIVKGVTSPEDAMRVQRLGVDAIYVSTHGGRQLDSAPPAIDVLPIIREAVGPEYPLIFDSGIRNGEDVVKALALGADFVMLGRPALYALAAAGGAGLKALLHCIKEDVGLAMAQVGAKEINEITKDTLFATKAGEVDQEASLRPVPLSAAK